MAGSSYVRSETRTRADLARWWSAVSRLFWRFVVGAFAFIALSSPCWFATADATPSQPIASGGLQAGPMMLEISGSTSTRLRLRNSGTAPVTGVIRVYSWTQKNGEDNVVPSSDLALSRTMVEVRPAFEEIVHVVNMRGAPTGRDRAYRVIVDQLPQSQKGDRAYYVLSRRYVIAAFVRAKDARVPLLKCSIESDRAILACDNDGGRAAQFGRSLLLNDRGDSQLLSATLLGYVLPGSRRVWRLSATAPVTTIDYRLETVLNGSPVSIAVDYRR